MNVEVHQVPGQCKPNQPQTGDSNDQVVEFGPKPASRLTHTAKRIDTNKNGADGARDAEDSKKYDPGRKPIDAIRVVGKRQHGQPPDKENEEENTNQTNQETAFAV